MIKPTNNHNNNNSKSLGPRSGKVDLGPLQALEMVPCLRCPVEDKCDSADGISPETCVSLLSWALTSTEQAKQKKANELTML